MSIGPSSPIAGSAAGTFLAQTRGSEIDRAQQEGTARQLLARNEQKAELAAGVGQTDGENHQTAERDADGRRLWEFARKKSEPEVGQDQPHGLLPPDPTGQSGSMLDLSG